MNRYSRINYEMKQLLCGFMESVEQIVTKPVHFHIAFESVHPFINGNGRTGRLLVTQELIKGGYPPIAAKFNGRIAYHNACENNN